ncbi:MAG: triose-phosphate isomerase [bacterium]
MPNAKLLIANWKMELSATESRALAADLAGRTVGLGLGSLTVAVCPSFEALAPVAEALRGSDLLLGAQDVFWEGSGAFTGEVSPDGLKELGCRLCLVGHSERRRVMGETDEMVGLKATALLKVGMMPVICVGETAEERESGRRDETVVRQLRAALSGLPSSSAEESPAVTVAYEPVWAIGGGKPVDPDGAAEACRLIRDELSGIDGRLGVSFRVIYGGSVDVDNLESFLSRPEIDGALVGSASLSADGFLSLAKIASVLSPRI